jgi:hypothetical protein
MKVLPRNDEMRKMLRHPNGDIPFRDEGPAEWPDDSFTHRRIMDGDITVVQELTVNEEVRAAPPKTK